MQFGLTSFSAERQSSIGRSKEGEEVTLKNRRSSAESLSLREEEKSFKGEINENSVVNMPIASQHSPRLSKEETNREIFENFT